MSWDDRFTEEQKEARKLIDRLELEVGRLVENTINKPHYAGWISFGPFRPSLGLDGHFTPHQLEQLLSIYALYWEQMEKLGPKFFGKEEWEKGKTTPKFLVGEKVRVINALDKGLIGYEGEVKDFEQPEIGVFRYNVDTMYFYEKDLEVI